MSGVRRAARRVARAVSAWWASGVHRQEPFAERVNGAVVFGVGHERSFSATTRAVQLCIISVDPPSRSGWYLEASRLKASSIAKLVAVGARRGRPTTASPLAPARP